MEKLRRITYDLDDDSAAPEPDQFLVSLTSRGVVSTVYHIAEARAVKTKDGSRRYALGVYKADDLKPHTIVEDGHITVKGETALTLVWNPRSPAAPRFHPAEVSAAQVFGDFLSLETAGAACLLVLLDGKVYRYGQWADSSGLQHVLGWCKFVDEEAFTELWRTARPTWYLPTAEALGYKVPPRGAKAEQLIGSFRSQVQHQAAILYYYNPEWEFCGWMCYSKETLSWAKDLNELAAGQVQALWYNHQVEAHNLGAAPYGFSPATYPEVMGRILWEQNEALRRDSLDPTRSPADRAVLRKMLEE